MLRLLFALALSLTPALAQSLPPPQPDAEPPSIDPYTLFANEEQSLSVAHAQSAALAHEVTRLRAKLAQIETEKQRAAQAKDAAALKAAQDAAEAASRRALTNGPHPAGVPNMTPRPQ